MEIMIFELMNMMDKSDESRIDEEEYHILRA